MKRRQLFISVALALVLTVLGSAPVLAAKPPFEDFDASGEIAYISAGTVFPAGASGRWVVAKRILTGTFLDGEDSDISGAFILTYKANVESVLTQAGNLHGKLAMDDGPYVINMSGKIEPVVPENVTLSVGYDLQDWLAWLDSSPYHLPPDLNDFIRHYNGIPPGGPYPLPKLTISGHWNFIEGAKGNGDFIAEIVFIPVVDEWDNIHVGFILCHESLFTLSGKWQPPNND